MLRLIGRLPALDGTLPRLVAAVGLAATACRSQGPPPSPAECDALLERYTELVARQNDPRVRAEDLQRYRREARARAATDARFAACPEVVSRRELECAMSADDADALERCLL